MAVTVGQLAVELDARTQEFRSAMRSAERRIDTFEQKAGRGTAAAGASFRGLVAPIAAIGTALAAIGATRALVNIGEGAVQAAGSFESYEIRLRALLGSQESANRSLESFVELSTKTPFAVGQIVEGATVLASVADGSRQELEELVKTTSNLAAVTGIPFNEAAANLQRSLAAGISAADKFREAGVRKLIEDVQGIPDLTKLPLEEQRQLFKDTFGPEALSPFATAAADLADTMNGALSNIGDAASNAQRELGEALSPVVFATARAVVIPFFQELEDSIVDNQDEITAFATDSIRKLLIAFEQTLRTGADLIELFNDLAREFDTQNSDVGLLGQTWNLFLSSVETQTRALLFVVADLGRRTAVLGNIIGIVSDERVADLNTAVNVLGADVSTAFDEFLGQLPSLFGDIDDAIAGASEETSVWADRLRAAAERAGLAADEVSKLVDQFQRARRERAAAQDETGGGARATGPDQDVLDALAGFGDDVEFDIAQEARLQAKLAEDRKKAEEDAAEASTRLAEGLAGDLTSAMGEGLAVLLDDQGLSFAEGLASLSGDLLEESIEKALSNLEEGLATALQDVDLGSLFGGEGGLGAGLGQALGAGLGIAGSFLARELGGTEASVRGGLVDSAVTSTQQLRGIVAGDVNVPIAEVAGVLRDMNVQTVAEQRTTNAILREIREGIRAIDAGGDTGESALAAAVADELNGSTALG